MKKFGIFRLLLSLFLAITLVACGSDDPKGSSGNSLIGASFKYSKSQTMNGQKSYYKMSFLFKKNVVTITENMNGKITIADVQYTYDENTSIIKLGKVLSASTGLEEAKEHFNRKILMPQSLGKFIMSYNKESNKLIITKIGEDGRRKIKEIG